MKFLDDILFLIGFLLVIVPTFLLNVFVGCYLLGFSLLVFSLLAIKSERKEE